MCVCVRVWEREKAVQQTVSSSVIHSGINRVLTDKWQSRRCVTHNLFIVVRVRACVCVKQIERAVLYMDIDRVRERERETDSP